MIAGAFSFAYSQSSRGEGGREGGAFNTTCTQQKGLGRGRGGLHYQCEGIAHHFGAVTNKHLRRRKGGGEGEATAPSE